MDAPDLILTGGSVFAPAEPARRYTTVAVRSGRIAAVGGDELREAAGRGTEVVHVGGGLVVPGFQDAHIHPVQGGMERLSCDLSERASESEYLSVIKAYADRRPDLDWVTGGGWMLSAFPGGLPRRESLDAVVADRPAFFPNREHHGAWVNTAALELAGVDASTPDPGDGRIEPRCRRQSHRDASRGGSGHGGPPVACEQLR